MNIIELASQRLQELARTGVEIPETSARLLLNDSGSASSAAVVPEPVTSQTIFRQNLQLARQPSKDAQAEDGAHGSSEQSENVELDLERLESSGVLVATRSRSAIAEEFRHIKRPLLSNAQSVGDGDTGRRLSLIMVTSALPGEGKSFCSLNLAISMAMEVNTSVLLVDADVVRASLMNTLGIGARKGLLDVLTDPNIKLSDVLLKTNVSKLSLLPAGAGNIHSTELLASDAMERLLLELANRYSDRIVVFDATPLLLTSEAKVLASRMGQVVMVVEEGRTPYRAVQQAFAAIEKCPIVMSVLNKGGKHEPVYGDYYK